MAEGRPRYHKRAAPSQEDLCNRVSTAAVQASLTTPPLSLAAGAIRALLGPGGGHRPAGSDPSESSARPNDQALISTSVLWEFETSANNRPRRRRTRALSEADDTASSQGFDSNEAVHWTSEEVSGFLRELRNHGKDFRALQRALPKKTSAQCVDFYYRMKYKSPTLLSTLRQYKQSGPAKKRPTIMRPTMTRVARSAAKIAHSRMRRSTELGREVDAALGRGIPFLPSRTLLIFFNPTAYTRRQGPSAARQSPPFAWQTLSTLSPGQEELSQASAASSSTREEREPPGPLRHREVHALSSNAKRATKRQKVETRAPTPTPSASSAASAPSSPAPLGVRPPRDGDADAEGRTAQEAIAALQRTVANLTSELAAVKKVVTRMSKKIDYLTQSTRPPPPSTKPKTLTPATLNHSIMPVARPIKEAAE